MRHFSNEHQATFVTVICDAVKFTGNRDDITPLTTLAELGYTSETALLSLNYELDQQYQAPLVAENNEDQLRKVKMWGNLTLSNMIDTFARVISKRRRPAGTRPSSDRIRIAED